MHAALDNILGTFYDRFSHYLIGYEHCGLVRREASSSRDGAYGRDGIAQAAYQGRTTNRSSHKNLRPERFVATKRNAVSVGVSGIVISDIMTTCPTPGSALMSANVYPADSIA